MFNSLSNIDNYKQYFDDLQDAMKKVLAMLFSGFRKYIGR